MSTTIATAKSGTDQPFIANGQKLFLASARLQAHAFGAAMRYQIEMLGFLKHRYEQDVKLVDELVSSDEFADAFDVVSVFMQNAATEYTSEAGRMASIGSKLGSQTARQMRRQANEIVGDVATRTVG
jgi:negative regulator of replication initiation